METKGIRRNTEIAVNEFLLWDKSVKGGVVIIDAVITEVREKAVKVDFTMDPVFVGSAAQVAVYNRTMWIPKSVIIHDEHGMLTVKKWFATQDHKSYFIKPYFIKNGEKKSV